jgi:hypothetical protein
MRPFPSHNKNWPLDEMKALMKEHLDITLQELQMAKLLIDGIIRQFPKKDK